MVLVICRQNFDSTTKFSTSLQFQGKIVKPLKYNRVVVLVHGFNAPVSKVLTRYKKMEDQILRTNPFDYVIGFLWPGSWTHALGYMLADQRAEQAGAWLGRLITILTESGIEVVVEGHSLGCKVMLHSMDMLKPKTVERWVMAAPAVQNTDLSIGHPTAPSHGKKPLRVLFSQRDPVLGLPFRLVPANWKVSALGKTGPNPNREDVDAIDFSSTMTDHSGYTDIIHQFLS
jgi:esterase/lipase superfamily enzyme